MSEDISPLRAFAVIAGAILRDGRTFLRGYLAIRRSPEIMALVEAADRLAKDFEAASQTAPAAPADPLPSIPAADAIAELSKEVQIGPQPEGPGNPQI